jgi:5-carboxymethyl-2-hydroxymuconate isomerase
VVPAAAIADPQALAIRARLNGQVMQDASTSQMIHGVADLIAFLSHGMTLEAGDVIATGTPSGVGAFRDPPVYLRPGDQIEIEIEGIGVLSNPVVACLASCRAPPSPISSSGAARLTPAAYSSR